VATVTFGDFEWDADKAAVNAAKHGVGFEEAVTVFLDLDCLLVRDEVVPERFVAIGMSGQARVLCARPMNEDAKPTEPSEESLREIPEQDFSRAIRPNRYANLRGAFQHAVFVDRDIWDHFGSEGRILEVLRLLVDIAKRRSA